MKQGRLLGPRHPEKGLGHPELKGFQLLQGWPTESKEQQKDLRQAERGRSRYLKCPDLTR